MIFNGFLPGTELTEIHQVLINQALPPEIKVDDLIRKEKAGKVTIEKLKPCECLLMMEKMHGKVFLNRKVFVTSVVAGSPQKPSAPTGDSSSEAGTPQKTSTPAENSSSASQVDAKAAAATPTKASGSSVSESPADHLNSSLDVSTTDSDSTLGLKTPIGPGIQKKLDIFDLKDNINDKRKAENSPEQETSKKEKKRLKEIEKAHKKRQYREKKQISLSKN